jgi:hypothetical protein
VSQRPKKATVQHLFLDILEVFLHFEQVKIVIFFNLAKRGYQRLLYGSTVPFWLFREINGDKVATDIILVFKSAAN